MAKKKTTKAKTGTYKIRDVANNLIVNNTGGNVPLTQKGGSYTIRSVADDLVKRNQEKIRQEEERKREEERKQREEAARKRQQSAVSDTVKKLMTPAATEPAKNTAGGKGNNFINDVLGIKKQGNGPTAEEFIRNRKNDQQKEEKKQPTTAELLRSKAADILKKDPGYKTETVAESAMNRPTSSMSRNAQNYVQMIKNAVNSGKGMDEIKAASAQAYQMYGNDAVIESLGLVNDILAEYKGEKKPVEKTVSKMTRSFKDQSALEQLLNPKSKASKALDEMDARRQDRQKMLAKAREKSPYERYKEKAADKRGAAAKDLQELGVYQEYINAHPNNNWDMLPEKKKHAEYEVQRANEFLSDAKQNTEKILPLYQNSLIRDDYTRRLPPFMSIPEDYEQNKEAYDRELYDFYYGNGAYYNSLGYGSEGLNKTISDLWSDIDRVSAQLANNKEYQNYSARVKEAESNKRYYEDQLRDINQELQREEEYNALIKSVIDHQTHSGFKPEYDRGLTANENRTELERGVQTSDVHRIYSFLGGGKEYEAYSEVRYPYQRVTGEYQYAMMMTDGRNGSTDEVGIFMDLYNEAMEQGKDPTAAMEFLKGLQPALKERYENAENIDIAEFAKNHPVMGSFAAIGAKQADTLMAIPRTVAGWFGDKSVNDPNSAWYAPSKYGSKMQDEVAENIGGFGGKVYAVGMNTLNNVANALTVGGKTKLAQEVLGLSKFFLQVYQQSTYENLQNNDYNTASWLGALDGVLEVAEELLPFDTMLNSAGKGFVRSWIDNALSEGLEELAGATVGEKIKGLFTGRDSMQQRADQILQEGGYTDASGKWVRLNTQDKQQRIAQAEVQALREFVANAAESTLAGAAGGGLGSVYGMASNALGTQRVGRTILRPENTLKGKTGLDRTMDVAALMKGTNSQRIAQKLQAKQEAGKKVSNYEAGKLVATIAEETDEKYANIVKDTMRRTIREQLESAGMDTDAADQAAGVIANSIGNKGKMSREEMALLAKDSRAIDLWKSYHTGNTTDEVLEMAANIHKATKEQRSVNNLLRGLTGRTNIAEGTLARDINESNRNAKSNEEAVDNLVNIRGNVFSERFSAAAKKAMEKDPSLKDSKTFLEDTARVWVAAMALEEEAPETNLDKETADEIFKEAQAEFEENDKQRIIALERTDPETGEKIRGQMIVTPGQGTATFDGTAYSDKKAWNDKLNGQKDLTRRQKRYMRVVAEIAQRMGHHVDFIVDNSINEDTGAKGEDIFGFEQDTGAITINVAGMDNKTTVHNAVVTLAHEMTHWLEQNSNEKYKALRSFLLGELRNKGVDVTGNLINSIANQADVLKDGSQLDMAGAMAELVARSSEGLFTSAEMRNRLMQTNPEVYNETKEFVRRFVARFNEALLGIDESLSQEAKILKDSVDQIAKLWLGAYDEAMTRKPEGRESTEDISFSTQGYNDAVRKKDWSKAESLMEDRYEQANRSGMDVDRGSHLVTIWGKDTDGTRYSTAQASPKVIKYLQMIAGWRESEANDEMQKILRKYGLNLNQGGMNEDALDSYKGIMKKADYKALQEARNEALRWKNRTDEYADLKEDDPGARYIQAWMDFNQDEMERILGEKREEVGGVVPYKAAVWYDTERHRQVANLIKQNNREALMIAAGEMAELVPDNAVLIPMPNHYGVVDENTDTMQLARMISELTGRPVMNALAGVERESRLKVKQEKRGGDVTAEDLGFRQTMEIPEGTIPYFIDNLVATGTTAQAAHDAFGRGITLAYAKSTRSAADNLKNAAPTFFDNKRQYVVPLEERYNMGKTGVKGLRYSTAQKYTYDALIQKEDMQIEYLKDISEKELEREENLSTREFAKEIVGIVKSENNGSPNVNNEDTGRSVQIAVESIKHSIGRGLQKAYVQISRQIKPILEKAIAVNELNARDNTTNGSVILLGMAESDENYYAVRFVVDNRTWKADSYDILYSISKNEIKKGWTRHKDARVAGQRPDSGSPSKMTIAEALNLVKDSPEITAVVSEDVANRLGIERPVIKGLSENLKYSTAQRKNIAELDERYMDAYNSYDDEEGERIVAEMAEIAMPNSKIRDENGKLKVVYHQTNADPFTVFDMDKARQNEDIVGAFFAPEYDKYHEYGDRTYAVYLNITNPAYDEYSFDKSKDGGGLRRRNELIAQGYDGVINTEDGKVIEYIAFYPEQIKSAEAFTEDDDGDLIPLIARFDSIGKNRNDIRWSTKQPEIEVRNFMEGLNESSLDTQQEKTMLRQFKELNQAMKIARLALTEDGEKLRKLEEKENPSAFDRDEMRKIRNRIETYTNKLSRLEDEMLRVTTNKGYAKLMYDNEQKIRKLLSGRTLEEVRQTIEAMTRQVEQVDKEMADRAKKIEEMRQDLAYRKTATLVDEASANKIADIIRKEYGSKINKKDLIRSMTEIRLKMAARQDISEDVENLAWQIAAGTKGEGSVYLDALRGRTLVLGKGQMEELKAQNSSLKEIRKELIGTGIKIRAAKNGEAGLDSDWEELCDMIPTLERTTGEKDQVEALLRMIQSEKRSLTGESMYEGHIDEVADDLKAMIAAVNVNAPKDPEAMKILNRMNQLVNEMALGISRSAEEMTAIRKEMAGLVDEGKLAMSKADIAQNRIEEMVQYNNALAEQSEAALWKNERNKLIYDLRSENTQNLLMEREKWRQRIEKDRQVRDSMASNQQLRKRVHTNVSRIWKLLRNESDQQNIPEYMKGLAREMVGLVVNNDLIGRKISGIDRKDLREMRRILDIMQEQDGEFDAEDLRMIEDEEAQAAVLDALADLEAGISFYNASTGKNILANLQAFHNALDRVSEAVATITGVINSQRTIDLADRKIAVADAAAEVAYDMQRSKFRGETVGRGSRQINFVKEAVGYGNETPVYFFKNLRNRGIAKLWNEFRRGENRNGLEVQKARDYVNALAERTHYKDWADQKHQIRIGSRTVEMTVGNMMELYAIWKREENNKKHDPNMSSHLEAGGVYIENDDWLNGKLRKEKSDMRPMKVKKEDAQRIYDLLTDEQKTYMEEMVKYLSTEMSDLGNETSMKMYGIKKYKESYYFPMRVWDGVKSARSDKGISGTTENRAASKGWTKRRKNNASNALLIGDFTQTAISHIVEMINYNTMAPAIENMNKVLNYQFRDVDAGGREETVNRNVRIMFQEAYGKQALKYLETFLKDLNGGPTQDKRKTLREALISTFRKNAVAGSLSVTLQQPLSYIRAAMMIKQRYLAQALFSEYWKGSYEELLKYSGIAVIKNMGRFDMNMGQSAKGYIQPDGNESVYAKISDWLTKAPELADRMTWTRMWVAVKLEQKAQHPEMDVKSDEFLKLCADRFNDVMQRTQVYDSVLVKSANMRSQNYAMKLLTSFMAEPTLSLNVLADAVRNVKEKGGMETLAKAGATFVLSAIMQALFKGIVGSGRTPDEKKTWLENFLYKWETNFISEINPISLIPGYSDMIEVLKNGELKDDAMGVLGKLKTAREKFLGMLNTGDWLNYRSWEDSVAQMWQLFTNIPLKNLMRDGRAMYNWISQVPYAKRPDSAAVLKKQSEVPLFNADNLFGTLNSWLGEAGFRTTNAAYYGRMFDAMQNQDEREAEEIREYLTLGKGVKPDAIASGLKKQAKEKLEPAEASQWMIDNDLMDSTSTITTQYKKGEITKEEYAKMLKDVNPDMTDDDVWWKIDRIDYEKETGEKVGANEYYHHLTDAINNNKVEEIRTAVNDLLKHGITQKKILDKTSDWKKEYLAADAAGKTKIRDAIQKVYKAAGSTAEEADKKINKWK